MTCRKARRELLERFRFGEELDARSAPHLEHLQTCLDCREEVGLDRALVARLRRALQARVEGYDPSPSSWQLVRERALATDSSASAWKTWFGRLTGRIRAAGAVAAVAAVLVLGVTTPAREGGPSFQLTAVGRGVQAYADRMSIDPPPYERPRAWFAQTPLPPPVTGRFSIIMTYGRAGEPVATVRPVPRLVTGLLE